jgi:hypothetical protein
MTYWTEREPNQSNIRLLERSNVWRAFDDELGDDGNVKERGCSRKLDSFLIEALNSTNLVILAGAGASLCATNPKEKPAAPKMDDLWGAAKQAAGNEFDQILEIIPDGIAIKNIEKLLTQCKLYVALFGAKEGNGKLVHDFIGKAERAILARVDFVSPETNLSSHEILLRKIARRGTKKPRARIYTTNYDLCFERAAQAQRFTIIDGFSHAQPQVYDRSHFMMDLVRRDGSRDTPDFIEGVFHLYKMHGSLDWRKIGAEIIRDRGTGKESGEPVLIYPRDSKYQEAFDRPYLDLMSSFQAVIREPDTTLLVAGFGFNDDHISQPIIAALESNVSFRLLVCDPFFIDPALLQKGKVTLEANSAGNNEFHKKLFKLTTLDDPRIAILNARFEDVTRAIPDLVAETERERQSNRMRALHDVEAKPRGVT